ncbi:outer membrane beta-barrel protein [Tenacibaculum sp. M341]|uniref:outer membrane beta-barrel protein n=1 Tax=Tenacibaculum sp. M341 TaxID=2530339 RepID=UPI00104AAC11|nr:outer membrane beta-barrel protein [Tenacibaculum sp. M341]TCI92090.1 hypothetical protein EYW44_07865 [Tenacibaculum sp. M341]
MKDKNIDRIFQEQLKDLEITPNPEIWKNIEDELTKKKKRRVIPFWWLSSGVAASLLLVFALFPFKKTTNINSIEKLPEEQIIVAPTKSSNDEGNEETKILNSFKEELVIKEDTINRKNSNNITTVAKIYPIEKEEKGSIVSNNKKVGLQKDEVEEFSKGDSSNSKIAMKKFLKEDKVTEGDVAQKEPVKETKKLPFKPVSEEELISNEIEKKLRDKWSISPMVGIVASNSLSEGSAIDANLSNNTLTSGETIAYGVKVAYEITDKWAIQSGIQLQKNIINTENVGFVENGRFLNNLTNVEINNTENLEFISLENTDNNIGQDAISTPDSESNALRGSLQQEYSYIEIPLETTYQLFASKSVKTNLVSGFSTLFLTNNSITANSDTFTAVLGEANNLNNVNFSGNIGVDFNIKLSEKLDFNINPMFKAHLNTFSKEAEGFKPYNVGLYSGLRYRF